MRRLEARQLLLLLVLAGLEFLVSGCRKDPDIPVSGTFIDSRDQKEYKWVIIGTQTWMSENLAWLPEVSPPVNGSDTTPYYYVFRFVGSDVVAARKWEYYRAFGVFYNWPAAMKGAGSSRSVPSGVQGVCPVGWHLPSDGEWDIMVNYLGGELTAGKKLKSISDWNKYDGVPGEGDNFSGFNAIAAGCRQNEGGFYNLGNNALFWSSTDSTKYSAFNRYLGYTHNSVFRYFVNKGYGYSIRCVKDN
jgi:uncharacterized protein (TIGR02145 family)